MNGLYELLAEKLEVDHVQPEDVLRDFPEWDSLTALAVVAGIYEKHGVFLEATELVKIVTAKDLATVIEMKRPANA